MATWTRILRTKTIEQGRLIMVETEQSCYYRYIIFPSDTEDWTLGAERIKSDFQFTSWSSAKWAGIRKVRELTPNPKQ